MIARGLKKNLLKSICYGKGVVQMSIWRGEIVEIMSMKCRADVERM
jgi:hypothetical protein